MKYRSSRRKLVAFITAGFLILVFSYRYSQSLKSDQLDDKDQMVRSAENSGRENKDSNELTNQSLSSSESAWEPAGIFDLTYEATGTIGSSGYQFSTRYVATIDVALKPWVDSNSQSMLKFDPSYFQMTIKSSSGTLTKQLAPNMPPVTESIPTLEGILLRREGSSNGTKSPELTFAASTQLDSYAENMLVTISQVWHLPSEKNPQKDSWIEPRIDTFGHWNWRWNKNFFNNTLQLTAQPLNASATTDASTSTRTGEWTITFPVARGPAFPKAISGVERFETQLGTQDKTTFDIAINWQRKGESTTDPNVAASQQIWRPLPSAELEAQATSSNANHRSFVPPPNGDQIDWNKLELEPDSPKISRYLLIKRALDGGSIEALKQCERILASTKMASGLAKDVAGALAASEFESAKDVLIEFIRDHERDPTATAQLLPLLAQGEHFNQKAADYVISLATTHGDQTVRSNANLALGSMINHWSNLADSRTETIFTHLLDTLRNSKSTDTTLNLINALGNSGHEDLMTSLQPWISNPQPEVRARAIFALRNVVGIDVEKKLTESVSSDSKEIQAAALKALATRELDDIATIRSLLSTYASSDAPEIKNSLRLILLRQKSKFIARIPELDKVPNKL